MTLSFFQNPWRIAVVFIGLGFLIYGNALPHPFVHDDVVFIQQNPNIARLDNLSSVFFSPARMGQDTGVATPYYRPLLEIIYRLEYRLFGLDPFGFHLFNVTVHVLNSLLLYTLLVQLIQARPTAFAAALIFLVHPVQTEAVACVAGISNLVFALFCFLSFLFYLAGRNSQSPWRIAHSLACLIFFVLALLSKEQAVVLPFIVLAGEWVVLPPRAERRWGKFLLLMLFGVMLAFLS